MMMLILIIITIQTFYDCICTVHIVRSLNLLTPTHTQLYFIKKPFTKLLHVSVYDHFQGVTISSLKSQLFKHSCMYTRCGGVAAYHVVCNGLCLWSVRVCVFLPVLFLIKYSCACVGVNKLSGQHIVTLTL